MRERDGQRGGPHLPIGGPAPRRAACDQLGLPSEALLEPGPEDFRLTKIRDPMCHYAEGPASCFGPAGLVS